VRVWTGSIVSNVGSQMNNVAKAWVLYQLTHSAAALGLEGLCFSAPIALLPLIAGPVVDRFDRVRVVKIALVVEATEAAALAAAAATGSLRPWMIYLAAAVAAARLSFVIPASSALIPGLVPDAALLSAQSLSAMVWSSAALIGPALGGVLLTDVNAATVFAINGLSTLIALLALRPVTRRTLRSPTRLGLERARPADGFRYLRRHRQLVAMQMLLLVTNTLLIGTETLLPVVDVQMWHGGTAGYGLLRMAPGIAAISVGFALSMRHRVAHPFRVIAVGIAVASGGIVAFVYAPVLAMALAILVVTSIGLIVAQIVTSTRLQQDTPDPLRGAVGGLTVIGQNGLAGIAAAGMAVAASNVGARATLAWVAVAIAPVGFACSAFAQRHRTDPIARAAGVSNARQDEAAPGADRRAHVLSRSARGSSQT